MTAGVFGLRFSTSTAKRGTPVSSVCWMGVLVALLVRLNAT
jgi:hypothetical protein